MADKDCRTCRYYEQRDEFKAGWCSEPKERGRDALAVLVSCNCGDWKPKAKKCCDTCRYLGKEPGGELLICNHVGYPKNPSPGSSCLCWGPEEEEECCPDEFPETSALIRRMAQEVDKLLDHAEAKCWPDWVTKYATGAVINLYVDPGPSEEE